MIRRLKAKALKKNIRERLFDKSLHGHGSPTAQRPPRGTDIFHMILGCRPRIGAMAQRGRLQLRLRLDHSTVPNDPRME